MAPLKYPAGVNGQSLVALKSTYCLERDLPASLRGLSIPAAHSVRDQIHPEWPTAHDPGLNGVIGPGPAFTLAHQSLLAGMATMLDLTNPWEKET